MKTFRILTLAAAAALLLAGCSKDPSDSKGGADSNWWYGYGLAPKGVKSITQDNFTDNYDKDGRLVSSKTTWGETKITYNSDGLPVKVEDTSRSDAGAAETTVQTLEYGNKGKFCPVPMGPGQIFHIFEQGLLPGLSKITYTSGDVVNVMEYKFSGDKLTVTTSGTTTVWDESGKETEAPYDDIVIEYSGAYPVKLDGEHEFLGPFTFQENGMFDTYVEGFYSWEVPGQVTLERTRTVSKEFKDKMVPEREVSKYYNSPSGELYDTETIIFTYNEHGDLIKEDVTHTAPLSDHTVTTYDYEYDDHSNWTKCKGSIGIAGGEPYNSWEQNRTIVYY